MKYLLDTNIVSHLMKMPAGEAAERISALDPVDVGLSIIVAAELRYGVAKSGSKRIGHMVEEALADFTVVAWDKPADLRYAELRAHLEKAGQPIGQNDMLIAAHALALDTTLVTDNDREFSRVPGLKVENWLRSEGAA